MPVVSKFLMVDGVRTHYLEAGEGPTLVLLHSGEFGSCAEISWEYNIDAFAAHFRVIAPDFIGYGRTDKIRDFGGQGPRMLQHITRFLEALCIGEADFIGNSLSGRFLCREASTNQLNWNIRRMISISGGGFEPDNEARRTLQDYDATREGMKKVLQVIFHDKKWHEDKAYVEKRYQYSVMPGAWEVAAASRFRSPVTPSRPLFGRPDKTEYENIRAPSLFFAGADDPLIEQASWLSAVSRVPNAAFEIFENCSHCAHIEHATRFNSAAIEFLLGT